MERSLYGNYAMIKFIDKRPGMRLKIDKEDKNFLYGYKMSRYANDDSYKDKQGNTVVTLQMIDKSIIKSRRPIFIDKKYVWFSYVDGYGEKEAR